MYPKITDTEIENASKNASPEVLDIISAYETSQLIRRLTDECGILGENKTIVAEEILFRLLKIVTMEESSERISERVGVSIGTSSQLLQKFVQEIARGILPVPTETADEGDVLPWEKSEPNPSTPTEKTKVVRSVTKESTVLGEAPRASIGMREKLVLRTEASADGQGGTGPKPLTREEVLQALAPKRTMASDIAGVKKGEADTLEKKETTN